MTRRERLMATLRGEPVDRPAVSFYELGGWKLDPNDPDPFNVHNDPSWRQLIELTEQETDIIRMVGPKTGIAQPFQTEEYMENGSKFVRTRVSVGGRVLTALARHDPEMNTVWVIEHLLKDTDDLKAYLLLPDEVFTYDPDLSHLGAMDEEVGDTGIVMVDTGDPLCSSAVLFDMEDYLVIAMTEPELFHALLEKHARYLHAVTAYVAERFPGHLWRIYGPEYAAEPYLPPSLFREYVVRYTGPMVEKIREYGGSPRIHCHGRIKNILPMIVEMGATGLDPIEPPGQGDVELSYVRREYGKDLVLFGNLEVSDVENMQPSEFEKVVESSLRDGTAGEGRRFVLMPSSAPYGREITPRTLANYQTMVRLAQNFRLD